jgi:hypothetical protein
LSAFEAAHAQEVDLVARGGDQRGLGAILGPEK